MPQETIAIAVEDKGGGSATDKRKKGVEGEVLDLRAQFWCEKEKCLIGEEILSAGLMQGDA